LLCLLVPQCLTITCHYCFGGLEKLQKLISSVWHEKVSIVSRYIFPLLLAPPTRKTWLAHETRGVTIPGPSYKLISDCIVSSSMKCTHARGNLLSPSTGLLHQQTAGVPPEAPEELHQLCRVLLSQSSLC